MLWYKKKRIFCCFSLLQSYKNLNLKKKNYFPFSLSVFPPPGMFVSYFVQNWDKFNQIFWSHLELLKEDKHFVKKSPFDPPAPPIFVWATPPKSPHPIKSLCCNLTIARVRQFCHLKNQTSTRKKNANKKNIESQKKDSFSFFSSRCVHGGK